MKERDQRPGPKRTRRPIPFPLSNLPVLPGLNPNDPDFPSLLQQEVKKAEKPDTIQALASCQEAAAQASQICLSLMYTHLHREDTTPTFKLCTFLAETLFQLRHELFSLEKWVKEQPCQTGAENKP